MFESKLGDAVGPFQEAVPKYDYWSTAHSLAAERLKFAVGSSILLTVFTGDAGSGKSTILRRVVSDAQGQQLIGVCKHGPAIRVEPCRAILDSFGAGVSTNDKDAQKRILQKSLEAARAALGLPTFILDDAENLQPEQFSEIFDLARLNEGPETALFKLILVGRPEVTDYLDEDIGLLLGPTFSLEPMSEKDTAGYVEHRLRIAGFDNQPFSKDALAAIYERTEGNPRQINLLCQSALAEASAKGIERIDATRIRDCTFASSGHSGSVQKAQATAAQPTVSPKGVYATGTAPAATRSARHPDAEPDGSSATATRSDTDVFFDAIERAKAELQIPEDPSAKPAIPTLEKNDTPNFKSKRTSSEPPPQIRQVPANDRTDPSLQKDDPAEPAAAPASADPFLSAVGPMSDIDSVPARRRWPVPVALAIGVTGVAALVYALASMVEERAEPAVDTATTVPETDTTSAIEVSTVPQKDSATGDSVASLPLPDTTSPTIDDQGPSDLLPPSDTETDDGSTAIKVPLLPDDIDPMLALAEILGDLPQDPEGWYRLGLSVADQDATAAAVAYTVAAGQGHSRAAYFLGQMYEIGEGIPVNTALAQHWYGVAGENITAAAERFASLNPAAGAALAKPVPLFSFVPYPGEAVLIWTSETGAADATYSVEFSDAAGQVISRIDDANGSFLSRSVSETERYWRVGTQAGGAQAAQISGWVPLDLQTETAIGVAATDP